MGLKWYRPLNRVATLDMARFIRLLVEEKQSNDCIVYYPKLTSNSKSNSVEYYAYERQLS